MLVVILSEAFMNDMWQCDFFFLAACSICFLSFFLGSFAMIQVELFALCYYCSDFTKLLESVICCLSSILENSYPLSFQCLLLPFPLSFRVLSGTLIIQMLNLFTECQIFLMLFNIFPSIL